MPENNLTFPTKKQYNALVAIHAYARQHGTAPTLGELAHTLGLAQASSAHFRVQSLARAGWVTTGHGSPEQDKAQGKAAHTPARTLRLTDHGQKIILRLERLYNSNLLRGENELVLNGPEYALARKLNLSLNILPVQAHRDRYIIRFPTRAERNSWAELLLEKLH